MRTKTVRKITKLRKRVKVSTRTWKRTKRRHQRHDRTLEALVKFIVTGGGPYT